MRSGSGARSTAPPRPGTREDEPRPTSGVAPGLPRPPIWRRRATSRSTNRTGDLSRSRAGPSADRDARERSRRRRLQIFAGVAVFSLLLATVATVSFVRARRESDRATQQARASAALALATQSRDADSQNPALGLALAADAILTTDVPLPQAEAALSIAYGAFVNRAAQQIGSPLVGSDGADDVAFSPDGARLASSHADGGVRFWDSQTGRSIGEPIPGLAGTLEFSPDGTLLASTSDRSVRLWNLVTNEAVGPSLEGDYVEFSPDGSLLATVDAFSGSTCGIRRRATPSANRSKLATAMSTTCGSAGTGTA